MLLQRLQLLARLEPYRLAGRDSHFSASSRIAADTSLPGRTLKIPKPRNSMRSPCDRARFMLSKTVSTAISALVLVIPVLFTTSLIMSSLIKVPLLAELV